MSSKTLAMKLIAVLESATLVSLVGCGGNTNQLPPPSQPMAITVTPSSATVQTGGVQQFTATVSPSGANQAVTWSLAGTGCTGASCGTIDATGKYTTPASVPNPPTVTVRATSVADPAKAAIAAINIMAAVNNSIPTISALSPRATAAGGPAFTLAVGGVNFGSSSVVRWNGIDRPTAFVNSGGVTAQIPAADIAATGTAAITVFNPGGGSSNSVPFSIGVGPASVAVAADPSGKFGKFVYVANANSENVSMYSINATTGVLTSIGEVGAGEYPASVVVDPSGKFAYVVNANSNNVSMYTIDPITGALTSTGTIAAGTSPASVAVDRSGKFAYVANSDSFNVSMYTIDATTGVLTSIGETGAGDYPESVVVDPSGKFAYVANFGDHLAGIPGSVSTYRINANGSLTSTGTIAEPYEGTASMAVHPSGKFAYVARARFSFTISTYTIDATTGALTSTGRIDGANGGTTSVAVHPSGKFAYMTNADISPGVFAGGFSNTISMYTIDSTTGALTFTGTIAAETLPKSVTVDPSGKFAYVANNFSNSISMYTIDAATGALTLIGTIGM
ncbi:MAG TPA: beta-propeller fold lactonase family protein [Candidatus Udaeobacter sp.]|nr:beta-propeller fold lactonase family protein [Candidatus Udaeobacter sp.]